MKKRLYSFGFNAFSQTGEKDNSTIVKTPQCHAHIKKLLFASWESTILIDNDDELVFWGYKAPLFKKLKNVNSIKLVCGEPDRFLGVVNDQHELSIFTPEDDQLHCMDHIIQAVYSQQSLFALTDTGSVYQCHNTTGEFHQLHDLPPVKKISGSPTCMLFLTSQSTVYGLGSNKLSQLGMDYQQQQLETPTLIDYFCGFQQITDIDCGPFHSSVIADREVYTFGWSKEGRLGWGSEENEDIISYATFLDVNEQPVDVNAVKVVCGSSHTLVLDNQGNVWSCGSNKYQQLGRDVKGSDYDDTFRKCTLFDHNTEQAIDCNSGQWTSFIFTKLL